MKVNIVVGGRFHAEQTGRALVNLGHDVMIYSSLPKRYFSSVSEQDVMFIPKPVQLVQKVTRVRMPRKFNEWGAKLFSQCVAGLMRPCDLLWGFNGDSLECGEKVKRNGGFYVLDRACPHFVTQQRILLQESQRLGYRYQPYSGAMERRCIDEYEVADVIVVPSEYSRRSFSEHKISKDRVVVAPLDANSPKPAEVVRDRYPDDSVVVGMVGGAFLRKGIIYLLRAFDKIDSRYLQLKIRANRADVLLHPEAAAICARRNVQFVPYMDDIGDFYRDIDIFVLPSIDEGFGMVFYEALSYGVPCIVSSNVGAIDGMIAGEQFLQFPAGNADALTDNIRKMMKRVVRKNIGEAGRAFYTKEVVDAERYQRAVEQVLSRFKT